MVESRFNPFEERLARDIRNELSAAILQVFAEMDITPALKIARHYLAIPHESVHEKYIYDRLSRYEQALAIILDEKLVSAWDQALVLWDLKLFFEVHEILEHAWLPATGAEKLVLQAMIRAAGMYIKLHDQRNETGARKMAAKAADTLEANRQAVPPGLPLDLLLAKLRNIDPSPPLLRSTPAFAKDSEAQE
ncbi:MAG: DUF309 domain-containing protein [Proteobacteria bacterium]|nr:DUF309 domain-containing protein [Pseudomonadota bacterium]MBU1234530.1 DUF309 domain-containing protein [Pseudomonadota bacterium]MBU1417877.1 DUF309 domain-containing protein [Pseudomonadota bacterium]MBU1453399.1 DUF309 domain-containing protein [Pseudomonadota bacterium]